MPSSNVPDCRGADPLGPQADPPAAVHPPDVTVEIDTLAAHGNRPGVGRFALPVLALIFAGLAIAARGVCPVGSINDDAQYVLQARALASYQGYQPAFAFQSGYPVFLVPFIWLFWPSLLALRLVSLVLMVVTGVLLEAIARRYLPRPQSLLVPAVFWFNPLALVYGTTCMSDPLAALISAASILLVQRLGEAGPKAPPSGALVLGLVMAWGLSVRLAIYPLAAVLVAALIQKRCWRAVAEAAAGLLLTAAVIFPLYHIQAVSAPLRESLWLPWWKGLPAVFGKFYLGFTTAPAASGAVVLGLAVLGAVRLTVGRRLDLIVGVVAAHMLFQSAWPSHDERHWLFIWPLLMLLAACALPPGVRIVLPLVAVLVAVPADVATLRLSQQGVALGPQRESSRVWLHENTAPGDVIGSQFAGYRTRLLVDREVGAPPSNQTTFAGYMAGMSAAHARYILEEPQEEMARRIDGYIPHRALARADLWLDSSTLVRRVRATPWDRVYEVRVSPGRYLAAFRHYLNAKQSADGAESERELRLALALVPDFPDAAVALAAHMAQDSSRRAEAESILKSVLDRYPVAFEAIRTLAALWSQVGNRAQALQMLDSAMVRARELEMADELRALSQARAELLR